jgi:4-hydroxy-tetrahydrodipicolinate synthase
MVGILQNEFPTMISGVKDSSGDRENTLTLLSRFKNLDILIGDERLLAEGISLGGSGAISGVANFRPDLLTALLDGKPAHANLVALVNELLQYPVTPAVKALVGYLSGADNWRRARAPLAGLDDAQYQALCKNYDALFGQ